MAGEWRTATVTELQRDGILLVEDGNHGEYRPRPDEFVETGVAFIRAADMDGGRVLFNSAAKINERARQRITKGIGAPGDVLLSHKGTVGKVALVPDDAPNFVCSPQTTFWRTRDEQRLDRKYLYAFLRSAGFHAQLATRAGETDMAPYVSLTSQRGLSVTLPPLAEQRAIAHILGTLDDKIELNRRMSETLEAMSRTLFKSWFVDFDPVRAKAEGRDPGLAKPVADLFPARLVDSELGEIPEGWTVGRLGGLADVEKGLSYKGEGLTDDGGLPMVNLGCFAGGGAFKAKNIKRYRGDFKERHLVSAGDLLVANTDMTQNRIILGSPALLPELGGGERFLFTHHTFAFRFKSGAERWRRYLYFTLLQPEFREVAEGFATGTTVLALPRDGLLNLALVLPPDPLLQAFERQVEVLLASADLQRRQSRTIAALRDTLLPKLISGELRASEAASLVEATA